MNFIPLIGVIFITPTYILTDGSRFLAVVSVTALRDDQNALFSLILSLTTRSSALMSITARRLFFFEREKLK
jgi:hypothetical protein